MSVQPNTARVLLVDDDHAFISRAVNALEPLAHVRTASSGSSALSVSVLWKPDVILLDLLLDDLDGFTFLEQLNEVGLERNPFILCTTDGHGADTKVKPLPNWRVGTLVRSSSTYQIRSAVIQAVRSQDPGQKRWLTV